MGPAYITDDDGNRVYCGTAESGIARLLQGRRPAMPSPLPL